MFGKAKKVAVVTEVSVRPSPTPRDVVKRGRQNERVSPGPAGPDRPRRAVRVRRGWPIRAYVGANGHGKSLCAVNDLLPSLDHGRRVLSTVPLLDWRADPAKAGDFFYDADLRKWMHERSGVEWVRPLHPNYVRLTEFAQLVDIDGCDIFMDEVAGVASSRSHQGLPAAVERLLQKLRHSDATLLWTAPAWARADLVIREVTQAITVCEGYRPKSTEHVDGRIWRQNRLFDFNTYDARAYTDWTEGKREKAKRLCYQRFNGPGSDAFNAYDTRGAVDTIIAVSDAGRCVHCGGTRAVPKCSCVDYAVRMAESTEKVAQAKRAAESVVLANPPASSPADPPAPSGSGRRTLPIAAVTP